ncbi:MAG: PEP-CTERM sorting domain-containing protein [Planctomycetota bacterium]
MTCLKPYRLTVAAVAATCPLLGHAQTIDATDARLVGFANSVESFLAAPGTSGAVDDPSAALGAPDAGFDGIPTNGLFSLGDPLPDIDPGQITLGFENAITNGIGDDFAVFENAGDFGDFGLFAELAFVEVSTDGNTFARFASEFTGTIPTVGGPALPTDLLNVGTTFLTLPDSSVVSGLAGADVALVGTLFDLDTLLSDALVVSGAVDLDEINFVRLVDIPGDGRFSDTAGNPIFDAFDPGNVTGGFDLDAVGVLNQVPEPGSALALIVLTSLATVRRRAAG